MRRPRQLNPKVAEALKGYVVGQVVPSWALPLVLLDVLGITPAPITFWRIEGDGLPVAVRLHGGRRLGEPSEWVPIEEDR